VSNATQRNAILLVSLTATLGCSAASPTDEGTVSVRRDAVTGPALDSRLAQDYIDARGIRWRFLNAARIENGVSAAKAEMTRKPTLTREESPIGCPQEL